MSRRAMTQRTIVRLAVAVAGRGTCSFLAVVPGSDRKYGNIVEYQFQSTEGAQYQQCSDLDCLAGLALRRVLLHCNTIRVYVRFHRSKRPWSIVCCMQWLQNTLQSLVVCYGEQFMPIFLFPKQNSNDRSSNTHM